MAAKKIQDLLEQVLAVTTNLSALLLTQKNHTLLLLNKVIRLKLFGLVNRALALQVNQKKAKSRKQKNA